MIGEIESQQLARVLDRRTALGKGLFVGFAAMAATMLGVAKTTVAEACSGCAACGSWCSCSDCYDSGYCYTQSDIYGDLYCTYDYECGYASTGCWTIDGSGGDACCDCWGCPNSNSPCTCRPRGYGC
jgi:hypothetical protein